jgi:hypothetical protein
MISYGRDVISLVPPGPLGRRGLSDMSSSCCLGHWNSRTDILCRPLRVILICSGRYPTETAEGTRYQADGQGQERLGLALVHDHRGVGRGPFHPEFRIAERHEANLAPKMCCRCHRIRPPRNEERTIPSLRIRLHGEGGSSRKQRRARDPLRRTHWIVLRRCR